MDPMGCPRLTEHGLALIDSNPLSLSRRLPVAGSRNNNPPRKGTGMKGWLHNTPVRVSRATDTFAEKSNLEKKNASVVVRISQGGRRGVPENIQEADSPTTCGCSSELFAAEPHR